MLRLTEQQYQSIKGKRKEARKPPPLIQPRKMNKTEARYAQILEVKKRSGEILGWEYEPLKLRLADNTYYCPDFLVATRECIEIHEVKGGFIRDDAKVKYKVARDKFQWFRFRMLQFKKGTWSQIL